MIIKTVAVVIFTQHEAHHIILTVQPDLVRKDMRHETRLFFYGVKMAAALDDLRDEGRGSGQQLIISVVKTILDTRLRHLLPPSGSRIGHRRPLGKGGTRPVIYCLAHIPAVRINSLSRPEPLRAVGLDRGHVGKA